MCRVYSTELHSASELPGTQGKKDDSGSYINDIIREGGRPEQSGHEQDSSKELVGAGGLHRGALSRRCWGMQWVVVHVPTAACRAYQGLTSAF